MPTIQRFAATRITMYAEDHNPPHFHIVGQGFEVLVSIGGWQKVGGFGRARDIADAMEWAMANEARLAAEWKRLNPERA